MTRPAQPDPWTRLFTAVLQTGNPATLDAALAPVLAGFDGPHAGQRRMALGAATGLAHVPEPALIPPRVLDALLDQALRAATGEASAGLRSAGREAAAALLDALGAAGALDPLDSRIAWVRSEGDLSAVDRP